MADLKQRRDRKGLRLDERFADEARFIKSWLENPKAAGAVSPSSRFLARAMAEAIDPRSTGPVVELGPGTGPVTEALVEHGVAPSRLVLVEYDPAFCVLLAERFPQARIVQGDAYDLARTLRGRLDQPPAAVISSLPLLNKPELHRLSLLADAFNMMRDDGVFVQFTYGMVSPVPRRMGGRRFDWFEAEGSAPVWRNLPPARVWVYRRPGHRSALNGRDPHPLFGKLIARTEKLQSELREKTERIEAELRGASDRLEAGLKGRTDKIQHEIRDTAGKVKAELRETKEKLEHEIRDTAEKVKSELRDLKDRTDRVKTDIESEWRAARRKLGARIAGAKPRPPRKRSREP